MRTLGLAAIAAFFALGCCAAGQAADQAIVLVPHRAVYDLTLDNSRSSTRMVGLTGRMVYEFTGSQCEGYTQDMRIVTESVTQEGESSLSDQRSHTWEDSEAKEMRFTWTTYRDQEPAETTSGVAIRGNSAEDDIKVELTHPERTTLAVTGKALFPVQHSIKLMEAARRGQTLFTADYFDGSEKAEKVYTTTTVIGRKSKPGFNKTLRRVANAEKLDGVPSWPVSISYFEQDADGKDAPPAYELAFTLFENGVSRRLFMDYGDYALRGDMKSITFLPSQPCRGH
jgi:EipB-like